MHLPSASDFTQVTFPGLGLKFNISKVAFYITDNFPIYWYAICITVGFALALVYAYFAAKKQKIDIDRFIDVILVSTVFAIIGARAYYVVSRYDELYKGNFASIFAIRDGGLAIYGGIIAAFVTGFIMCKIRKLSTGKIFDIAGVGFLIGQGVGRLGNFFNQEAFGTTTSLPWGMYSDETNLYIQSVRQKYLANGISLDPMSPVHPCFLYEMIWCFIGVAVLHFVVMKHKKFDGQVFLSYCIWYGVGRFFIESLRTDSLMTFGGAFKVSQVVAVFSAVAAAILMIVFLRKKKEDEKVYTPVYETAAEENSEKNDAEAKESVTVGENNTNDKGEQ